MTPGIPDITEQVACPPLAAGTRIVLVNIVSRDNLTLAAGRVGTILCTPSPGSRSYAVQFDIDPGEGTRMILLDRTDFTELVTKPIDTTQLPELRTVNVTRVDLDILASLLSAAEDAADMRYVKQMISKCIDMITDMKQ